jgi:two-component system chemotaxis response regulator CheB
MPKRDIIVIGTSAGGIEALLQLVRGLPSGFPASLIVVCHLPASSRSVLPEVLSRAGPLLATHPANGDHFSPGHIYIAPPDHHLLLGPDARIRLNSGARENNQRPAADPLFRSAARYHGPRVIGVVLTGALYDGTAGLMAVRASGGIAVVQDPGDALVAAMPENAAQIAGADYVVRLAELPSLLVELVQSSGSLKRSAKSMDPIARLPEVVDLDMSRQTRDGRRGEVCVFTCPECGGSLWQVDDSSLVRFRCHVGHAYDGEILLSEQTDALEAALWTSVRTFKEKSVLASQMAHHDLAAGNAESAARFEEQAGQAAQFGGLIQQMLLNGQSPVQ